MAAGRVRGAGRGGAPAGELQRERTAPRSPALVHLRSFLLAGQRWQERGPRLTTGLAVPLRPEAAAFGAVCLREAPVVDLTPSRGSSPACWGTQLPWGLPCLGGTGPPPTLAYLPPQPWERELGATPGVGRPSRPVSRAGFLPPCLGCLCRGQASPPHRPLSPPASLEPHSALAPRRDTSRKADTSEEGWVLEAAGAPPAGTAAASLGRQAAPPLPGRPPSLFWEHNTPKSLGSTPPSLGTPTLSPPHML